jgi:predicted chitinase
MRANEFLTELFNKPYQLQWDDQFGPKEIHARAYDRQGQYIDINFVPVRDNVTDIEFSKMDNFEETGQGDEIAIFSTVLSAIKRYLDGYQPKIIVFSGKGGRKGESRAKLYQQLINRFARQYGYQQFDLNKLSPEAQKQIAASSSTGFVLRKMTVPTSVTESKIVHYDGIDLDVSVDGASVIIHAVANGKQLGYVVFERDGNDLNPLDLSVDERFRNQGIAKTMYDYTKSLGFKIKASIDQTEAGKAFWHKHRPGKYVWEDEVDEGVVDWAKKGAAAGAIALGALGAGGADAKPIKPTHKPAIVQPAKQQVKQPTQQAKQQVAPQAQAKQQAPEEYNVLSNNIGNELTLHKAAKRAGMKGAELAQFMAQMKHESWDFERMKEKAQPGVKDYYAKRYDLKYSPKTAKILGNKHVGDGAKYHGRGFVQLTGRDNYRMAGDALGIDLLNHPDLASKPDVAAKVAVWYWQTRVKPSIQNFADTASVTKKINPAARGLENRHENFKDYMRII